MYNKDKDIIITVEGGVIQDITFPPGCKTRIIVQDFDIEGTDEDQLTITESGDECVESEYDPAC